MVSKLLEFKMSALVLTEMSAFELKAWLGLCLFASYATDIITATDTFSVLKLLAIVVTAIGLFMIARSEREHISYKKIAVPLFFYLLSKSATALLSLRLRRTYPHTLPCFSDYPACRRACAFRSPDKDDKRQAEGLCICSADQNTERTRTCA